LFSLHFLLGTVIFYFTIISIIIRSVFRNHGSQFTRSTCSCDHLHHCSCITLLCHLVLFWNKKGQLSLSVCLL